jgi:CRP/FNR family transcriptional regulator, cyclic AMP receptor protein
MNLSNLFKNANNVVEYSAGATIFSSGEHGELMYVVLDGEVDVQVNETVVDVIKPGDIFGEMALIDAGPRSATAVAKSDCRLASVDEKLFLYMVQQTPFFSLEVMRTLADRLRLMNSAK